MRFPAARDTDQRQYQARLDYLAQDTAHITVPLLRAACDRVARDAKGLPFASEIIRAATELVEERQRVADAAKQAAPGSGPVMGDKAAAYAAANVRQLGMGGRVMQADDGSVFRLGDAGDRRGVRRDGSAIVPYFRHDGEVEGVPGGWYVRSTDADVLAACYRHYEAKFALRGSMIVEAI